MDLAVIRFGRVIIERLRHYKSKRANISTLT